jgi:transcription-repair coupling factor (superfamily II helicase)
MQAAEAGTPPPATDATAPDSRPSLDLPLHAFLPEAYVTDEATRLNLYQRFAALTEGAQLGELIAELQDRFGPLPEEAQNLAFLVGLRLQAAQAGVAQVSATPSELIVKLRVTPPTDLTRLSRAVGAPVRAGSNQLRIPRGRGQGWIVALQALVDALVPTAA